jgi:ankyrin repeat protein
MADANESELEPFRAALREGDAESVRRLLATSAALRGRINDPIGPFGSRPVQMAAQHPRVMDHLLDYGADINLRSDWANGPFSVLDSAPEEAVRHYLTRGAILTPHAAARLGWIEELAALLDADPARVHEKGADGQRPLHFAKTPAIVDLLLDRGAEIDARCDDHRSTPAQYALVERPDVCRHLIARGATPDIFIAARLGEVALVDRLIDADPASLAARVNAPGYAPVAPFNIYCWSLGWYLSPHEVAWRADQKRSFDHLMERSPDKIRFLVACALPDKGLAKQIAAEHADIASQLAPADHALLPYSIFHNRPAPALLMLSLGFDPAATGVDGGTPLHTAAWHGQREIVETLLRDHRHRIDIEARDTAHNGTPLGWAIHGSKHSWAKAGDHVACARLLIDAGAQLPERFRDASDTMRALLHSLGVPDAG